MEWGKGESASLIWPQAKKYWDRLEHNGPLFPPLYQPHGVKMLYDGEPVDLNAEEEEVATFFAGMLESEYVQKDRFLSNFWKGFRNVLTPEHRELIQDYNKCDFTPIYNHLVAEREKKKNKSKEEKQREKKEKEELEKQYMYAKVDDRWEKIGNFRIEPPGLFRGRGEHPKMGMIKVRLTPPCHFHPLS